MIALSISITNLDALRTNFRKAPSLTLQYLSKATQAALFEVEKQAVDRNFRFKTPRAFRTGFLALSFAYGRKFSRDGLRGAVGPTAHYARYVYDGTSRGIVPNRYMDRIAKEAEPDVNKHFEKAVDTIVAKLAQV